MTDLYLASQSPRRRELLGQLGVQFEPLTLSVPEERGVDEPPAQYVERLALEKAAAQHEHEGWAYFFCSNACHTLFLAAPERYSSSRRQVSPAQADKEP